jgi:hypothetical protein
MQIKSKTDIVHPVVRGARHTASCNFLSGAEQVPLAECSQQRRAM